MSNPTNFPGDGYFNGEITCTDVKISGTNKIDAKYQDGNLTILLLSQESTVTDVTNKPGWVAQGTGTVKGVKAGSVTVAVGDGQAVIDVKKNGTSILSSTITLDNANSANTSEEATLDGTKTSFAADDYFTVTVTGTAASGTKPAGLAVTMSVDQDYPH